MGKINLSKSTFLILFLAAGFFVGISFSSVYAGIPWGTSEIADNAIISKKIKNKQITAPDIRDGAVKSNKIRDGTITSADIAADAVGTSEIAAGAVDTSEIATDAVTLAKIADNAVNFNHITTDAVRSSEIIANAVGGSEIAGTTKLLFAFCHFPSISLNAGASGFFTCSVPLAALGDEVVVTREGAVTSFIMLTAAKAETNSVKLNLRNTGPTDSTFTADFSIIVFNAS